MVEGEWYVWSAVVCAVVRSLERQGAGGTVGSCWRSMGKVVEKTLPGAEVKDGIFGAVELARGSVRILAVDYATFSARQAIVRPSTSPPSRRMP